MFRSQFARFMGALAALCLLAQVTGCSCPKCCSGLWGEPPPPPPVKNVFVWFDHHLHITSDPVRQGAPLPGLAGRVYLSGEDPKKFVDSSGKMQIEMYDMTNCAAGAAPQRLVVVTYEMQMLKPLKQRDQVGEGYTLFIPWDTYNPAVKDIKLQLAYFPEKGTPYYADPFPLTLQEVQPMSIQGQGQQVVPASYKTPEKK